MKRISRWPAAAACLGLGLAGWLAFHDRAIGQAPPAAALPEVPRDLLSYAPIVKRVVPAVVSIEGKGTRPQANPALGRPTSLRRGAKADGDRFLEVAGEPVGPAVDPGFGSGFLFDPAGVVLTNNHVVEDVDSVEVQLGDGRKFTSRDIRRDAKTDLAVIKFQADGPLPFLEFGDSDAMEVGDRVLAVGAPFGLTGSVTHGIVSAKSRNNLRLNQFEDFLQTDAAINPGNSGGPLVNLEGRVIGITSAIKTRSGGFQGVGLAVSSNLAKNVAQQLLKDGTVHRGSLGVTVRDIDAAAGALLGVAANGGVVVVAVAAGGSASKGLVQVGDAIVAVAGKPIKNGRDLQRVVAGLPLGQPAEVIVVRASQPVTLTVTVEEPPAAKPATATPASSNKVPIISMGNAAPPAPGTAAPPGDGPPPAAAQLPDFGLVVAELTPQIAAQLKFAAGSKGVAVLRVEPKGLAALAGVARGTAIVKVDDAAVTTVQEFRRALAAADRTKGALVQSLRPNGDTDFAILKAP